HDTPHAAWEAVEAFDRRHPFVPVVAVLDGARDFRNRKRTYPARVDWIADFKELGESSLRMAIRFARERARRRELEHRLEERHLEDYGWILSEVAHEIRDPLQSLTANLEWAEAQVGHLQQRHEEIDLERLQEAVRDSRSGLVVVSRIAADLDRSSRSMRLGRVDLREVFDTLRRLSRKSLHDVTLTIRHGHGPTVRASETRLCQVFLNLFRNAVQALGDRQDGTIDVVVHSPDRGRVAVTVRDNGPGMPDHVAEHLFTPWFTTKATGTGIGLAVSRRYIHEMGGTLELTRTGDDGTEFRVELQALPGQLARPTLVPDPSILQARVLVVDDTALIRRSMERALQENHDVVTVGNVEEAIEQIRTSSFDLAVVDMHLPGRSGLDLYDIVRTEPRLQMPRFLFLSGEIGPETEHILDSRGLPFVRKPVGAHRLNELVVETLQAELRPPDEPDET
ncbi:MAG: ATP-binding protein, partial [Myxococcota bacterium]